MTSTTASYREDVMNNRPLLYAWRSHASRPLGSPPIGCDTFGECLKWLGLLAARGDSYAQVVRAIGMPPLYQTAGEAAAHVYRAAFDVMSKPYDDVIGRTGPEAGRPSQYRRDWTLTERVVVLAYLRRATHAWSGTGPGYGWAMEALATEIGALLPPWEIRRARTGVA